MQKTVNFSNYDKFLANNLLDFNILITLKNLLFLTL
jgi:hypothetical protein